MQDRYAGDIGDYVKLALLRALSPGLNLGVAWYLYPDENHNGDGRHVGYLDHPGRWRELDPELFDTLRDAVRDERTVSALEASGALGEAVFASQVINTQSLPPKDRSEARTRWFDDAMADLSGCDLVFADPDNGLVGDRPERRRQKKFGKQIPLAEALALSKGRQAVIYHHNTRFPGGHDLEVRCWQQRLGMSTLAIRANAYSCRTFFILNPTELTRERAAVFARRWTMHQVRLTDRV